ncbi:MAG: hypothetical protein Q9227_000158 [Pyrenula ochraceoflavens]
MSERGVFRDPVVGYCGLAVTDHRTDFDKSCSFCTFVLSFDRPKWRETNVREFPKWIEADEADNLWLEGYHLRAFDSLKVLRLWREHNRVSSYPSVVLAVVVGQGFNEYSKMFPLVNRAISKGLIVPKIKSNEAGKTFEWSSPYDFMGRKIQPHVIDFALLRTWIDECKSSKASAHERCNKEQRQDFSEVHVIDCRARRVVPLQKEWNYLALSYVWGQTKSMSSLEHSEPALSESLPLRLPQTIQDAITVTVRLGQNYLWVDKYCIKATVDKHLQIQNMGLVYEGALATIIAVPGENSDFGLPGISLERNAQACVEVDIGTLVSTGCHPSYPISNSRWYTRGWTYQEAFLSRRCLLFTHDQVFFACKVSLRAEMVLQPPSLTSEAGQQMLGPSLMTPEKQFEYTLMENDASKEFTEHLLEYSSRSLSFDSDRLTAFKGMLARQKFASYWGVPFFLASRDTAYADVINDSFAVGLSWFSGGAGRDAKDVLRRAGFPTWCWASLNSRIEYASERYHESDRGEHIVKISMEHSDGHTMHIGEFFQSQIGRSRVFPENAPWLHITGYTIKVRLHLTAEIQGSGYAVDEVFPKTVLRGHALSVYIDTPNDDKLRSRLKRETWIAIALWNSDEDEQFWLLLDWRGSTAYRIGLIQYSGHGFMKDAESKTIRLG